MALFFIVSPHLYFTADSHTIDCRKILKFFIYLGTFGLLIYFDATIAYMSPQDFAEGVTVSDSPEEINTAKTHFNHYKSIYLKLGGVALSLCLAYIFFSKGSGGDSGSALDFQAVHWGSDSASEAGSDVVAATMEAGLGAAAAVIAAAAPFVFEVAVAQGVDISAIDPRVLEYAIGQGLDLVAYAEYHPEGYLSLIETAQTFNSASLAADVVFSELMENRYSQVLQDASYEADSLASIWETEYHEAVSSAIVEIVLTSSR